MKKRPLVGVGVMVIKKTWFYYKKEKGRTGPGSTLSLVVIWSLASRYLIARDARWRKKQA